jgi:hypothetical protein
MVEKAQHSRLRGAWSAGSSVPRVVIFVVAALLA